MRHHFFLSHFQKEAADTVKALFYDFRYHHCSAWIDMRAQVITAEAMRAGVRDSDYFVLVLTANVLNRPFCLLEACTRWSTRSRLCCWWRRTRALPRLSWRIPLASPTFRWM
eukprot:m.317866 g.317866  ORF g.317866 m.317866 type:complete len:112 (+) comp23081_c0_seq11:1612-1947(+)